MLRGKTVNEEVNGVHQRALRVLLNDLTSAKLMLEVYKCITSGSPSFLWEFFNVKMLPYSLRINDLLQLPTTRASRYGNESHSFWGSMVWNGLPDI